MSRIFRHNDEEHDFWMSYTDLMAGFLTVFIIIGVVLYYQYNEIEKKAKAAEENYCNALDSLMRTGNDLDSLKSVVAIQKQTLVNLIQVHDSLIDGLIRSGNGLDSLERIVARYKQMIDSLRQNDLKNQISRFRDVFPYNSFVKVDFDTNKGSIVLTPRSTDPKKDLFGLGKSNMKQELKDYLRDGVGKKLIERTMDIWMANGCKNIELRIEGHTDPTWGRMDKDRGTDVSFVKNLELSSERANNVYKYILYHCNLSVEQQTFVKRNMVSVGYSFSSRLQQDGDIHDKTKDAASRRIEFRIISK